MLNYIMQVVNVGGNNSGSMQYAFGIIVGKYNYTVYCKSFREYFGNHSQNQ